MSIVVAAAAPLTPRFAADQRAAVDVQPTTTQPASRGGANGAGAAVEDVPDRGDGGQLQSRPALQRRRSARLAANAELAPAEGGRHPTPNRGDTSNVLASAAPATPGPTAPPSDVPPPSLGVRPPAQSDHEAERPTKLARTGGDGPRRCEARASGTLAPASAHASSAFGPCPAHPRRVASAPDLPSPAASSWRVGLTRELLRLFGPDQVTPELAAFRARLRGNEALARSHVYDLAVQGASLRASCPALGAAASSLEVPPAPPQTLPEAGGGQTIGRPPHEGSACLGQAGDAMEAAGPVEGPAPAAAAPAFAALGSVVAAIAARNPLALAAAHLDNAAHLLPSVRSRLGPDDVEVLCQTWRKCGVNGVGRGGGAIDAHHAAELLAHLCHAARTPCPDDVRRNAAPNGRTAAEQRLLQAQEVLDAWTQHSAHPLGACPCRRQMGPISTAVWLLGAQLDLLALHVELQAGTVEPEDAQMRLCQTRCAAQDLHDAACARGTGGVGEARHARYGSASLAWAVLDFMQTVGPDQWPAWLPLISALTTALGRADDHPDVATQMHRWLTEVLPTCLDASGCVEGRTSGR